MLCTIRVCGLKRAAPRPRSWSAVEDGCAQGVVVGSRRIPERILGIFRLEAHRDGDRLDRAGSERRRGGALAQAETRRWSSNQRRNQSLTRQINDPK